MVRTQVYLTAQQHRALKREAKRTGLSLTELLRRAVDLHLRGAQPPASPQRHEGSQAPRFGFARGTVRVHGDIIEPIDVDWEAAG